MLKKVISCIAALSFALVASAASAGNWTTPVNHQSVQVANQNAGHSYAAGVGVTNFNNPYAVGSYCTNVGFIYQYYTLETTPAQGSPGGIIRPGRTFVRFYNQVCQ